MPTFSAQHAQDRRTRRVMKIPGPLVEQRWKELQQAEFGTGGYNSMNLSVGLQWLLIQWSQT
ncbi:protein kinase superfamily protein [Artemisia annua]|uniref:Protein kinase superfamily protein n=1 Tax=Artemisia annua TaxID=35608 RepID=A0A2U1PAU4_ARTAN|nr:protein kinase superfamily protein [Artemisia annua]